MPEPIELLTIIAAAKKETAKAVKDALPTIADMVQSAVDAKEIKTIADIAATIKGDKGDNGADGPKGEKGDKGDQGPQGIQGPKGADGINGVDGRDGRDGKDGSAGRNGTNGKDGVGVAEVAIGDDGHLYVALDNGRVIDAGMARGRDGKDGKAGTIVYGGGGGGSSSGGSGTQGPAGADGASAYEVAVAEGFTGTVEDWLASLVGATGPQGQDGPQGIQGIQGPQGVKGDTGDPGATGPDGPAGPQGIQGIQGIQGETGPQGDPGTNGPNGVDGADGQGVPIGGTTGQVLTKSSGTDFDTAWTDPDGASDPLVLSVSTPTTPDANTVTVFRRPIAGRQMIGFVGQFGMDSALQPLLARNKIGLWNPPGYASTVPGVFGMAANTITNFTATARSVAVTNLFTRMRRLGYATAATAGAVGHFRAPAGQYTIGNGTLGGFFFVMRFGISDAAAVADARMFMGVRIGATPSNVEPSTLTDCIGIGHGASDTTLRLYSGGSVAQTPIDLGADFPADTRSVDMYELALFAPPSSSIVNWEVTRLNTGHVATGQLSGTVGTQIPATTTLLAAPWGYRTNNATALAAAIDVVSVYTETDY